MGVGGVTDLRISSAVGITEYNLLMETVRQTPEWVSIEDRLPKELEYVWVHISPKGSIPGVQGYGYVDHDIWHGIWLRVFWDVPVAAKVVTHWMSIYMPEPPA